MKINNFLEYYQLKQLVQKMFKENNFTINQEFIGPYIPTHIQSLIKNKKGGSEFYKIYNKINMVNEKRIISII